VIEMKKLPRVSQRFIRYIKINTQANPLAQESPSSPGQMQLAELLVRELEAMGAAEVELTPHGVVLATIPGASQTIGLLAHLDTSPQAPGGPVNPMVHEYRGGEIVLPYGRIANPILEKAVGCQVITSDGSTLLGADNKAGIAAIMEAAERLLAEPAENHATVRIAFTPDEELGRGTDHLDLNSFGVKAAYTVDGGSLGELEWENFYAQNLKIAIEGRSIHPGSAYGRMVNAVRLAGVFCASLPATALPETTRERAGFIHVDAVRGDVERTELDVIIRDFTREGLAEKRKLVENLLAGIVTAPGSFHLQEAGGYLNMKAAVAAQPKALELARQAMERVGVEPVEKPIRGGTDGAKLAEAGIPCPNLFTGGGDFHSRAEWLVAQWHELAVEVLVELTRLWKDS